MNKRVVFVGQGPNQTAWAHGLALGRSIVSNREPSSPGKKTAEEIAESYCAKVAITGAVGKKIAALAGFPLSLAFGGHERRNLNARFNGKEGKGDVFDRIEGIRNSERIVTEAFTHHVLLGAEVAKAFGFRWEPLGYHERAGEPHKRFYLLLPHPSGINAWWNDDFNRFRAKKRLREFVTA